MHRRALAPTGGVNDAAPTLQTFAAFESRPFRLLWLNTFSFVLVSGIQRFVFVWLALEISDRSIVLGLVSCAIGVPVLFFSLPAGVLSDRLDRQKLLVASQVAALVTSALAAVMAWSGLLSIGVALGLAFLLGTALAFGQPARQAIVPSIVEPDRLMNAITLTSFSQNLSQIAGPALGGLTIAALGVGGSFAVQAGLLALGLLALVGLRVPPSGATGIRRRMRAEIHEGLRFVWRTRDIRTLIGMLTVSALITAGPWSTLIPKLAKDELGSGAFGASMLFTAMGIGTVLASLVLASIRRLANGGGWFLVTVIIGSSLMIGLGLSKVYGLTLGLMFLSGLNAGFFMNLNLTLIQAHTPQPEMGRVMSIYSLCFMGGIPLGALLAGIGAGIVGAPAYFALCGITMAVIAFVALVTQSSLRRMTTVPGEV